jgi:tryptophanyl-tRNA synthetase
MTERRADQRPDTLTSVSPTNLRVLSGMRPTGRLHLGHYHGVLKNWVELQHEYECFFFVADWHALTTDYDDPSQHPAGHLRHGRGLARRRRQRRLGDAVRAVAGAGACRVASVAVDDHAARLAGAGAELQGPAGEAQGEGPATYGFLGYPLLQSADILIYKAGHVPVGEDQVAHVEMTREIARRFNHIYGREPDFEDKAEQAKRKMGKKNAKMFDQLKRRYRSRAIRRRWSGPCPARESQANITVGDRERLFGYLEGGGRVILPEPQPLLTKAAKMPGLDGQKMSKSYGNTIALRDDPDEVEQKLRTMPTDPQRMRRTDPGNPDLCPVWQFHLVYSETDIQAWVQEGCRSAGIGCIECKQPVDRRRARRIGADPSPRRASSRPSRTRCAASSTRAAMRARDVARETMDEVRRAMSLRTDRATRRVRKAPDSAGLPAVEGSRRLPTTRPARRTPAATSAAAGDAAADLAGAAEETFARASAGPPVLKLPEDLYIPPDALEVFLDAFEGPLDLLLYLIRKQNLDILDIPISADHHTVHGVRRADEGSEAGAGGGVPGDGRHALRDQIAHAAAASGDDGGGRHRPPRRAGAPAAWSTSVSSRRRRISTTCRGSAATPSRCRRSCPAEHIRRVPPTVELGEVLAALRDVLARADLFTSHKVERESLSLRERMSRVLATVQRGGFVPFAEMFDVTEGRAGVVVSFLAILELVKAATLELVQSEAYAPIHVRLRGGDA